ncbi:mitotic-spindle organizing protein 2 isoform X2 [Strongylocentrotus purpuratus]|nr:mitotic-spindle organizing protein 2 isoform X2 [Strongylocentrotus purpuratus]XP_011678610.1 mitotic-spindle organizing protein 2 isoform X2 [Strongylocentrotus purpuratus]|eukprot:XP_011678609.1 PREDICTED: mitotic-spindle organizing protein 2-like [Strongylocentrotus purpuratus]
MTSHRSGQSYKYSIAGKRAKDALNKDEQELFELCCLAGVEMSPAVYRIIMNLLKMNVSPIAITQMLKAMVNPKGLDPTPTPSMTTRSSASSSDIPGTGTGTYPGHSLVKRSASHSAVSGGSSTSGRSKGGSRSTTSLQSDSSGRSRSGKTSSNTRT